MLTSKARRRRLAIKTSALAVAGVGIFWAVPAVVASAQPIDVPYTCNGTTYPFQMELKTPAAQITPNATVTLTWDIQQPTATPSRLLATAQITPSSTIVAEGTVSPSGTPMASTAVSVGVTSTPAATISQGSPMPLPTFPVVVKPTVTGTVGVKGGGFSIKVNSSAWYTCTPVSGGPSLNLVVSTPTGTPSGTPSGTPTNSSTPTTTPTTTPTNTPTTTPTSPRPTTTRTRIVTETPRVTTTTTKSSRTPKAGADTGGGGTMGPDGRMFVLTGSALILAAGIGGLLMRRRTVSKG